MLNLSISKENIHKRYKIKYSLKFLNEIESDKDVVLAEINSLQVKNISVIYQNQNECAIKIVEELQDRKIINIMILALTQSGKTGTMNALIKNYLIYNNLSPIPIENIYIITGLSSKEWVSQTKIRLPKSIEDRVFHRDHLTKDFVNNIKDKKNVLIICDEIQIAARKNQTLHKSFKDAGYCDKDFLLNNDIKIIEFTATPDGTIYDQMKWEDNSCKIQMHPGEGYTSCFDLYNSGRVFQYKDLYCFDRKNKEFNVNQAIKNITEIKKIMEERFDTPMYHIIRTPNGDDYVVVNNFKKVFGNNIDIHYYNENSEIEDINDILNKKPNKDTFIFIKEKLRCAKTLVKLYLGVLYERYSRTPNDSVITQGLLGRSTGYDDNGKTIIFTNIDSIEKYERLWDTNFEDKSISWKSNTTTSNKTPDGKELTSKGTYLDPSNVNDVTIVKSKERKLIRRTFTSWDKMKEYFIKKRPIIDKFKGKKGPTYKKMDDNGFYIGKIKGKAKVWSWEEIDECPFIGTANNGYWFYSGYEDVNDKNTLKWFFFYYKN